MNNARAASREDPAPMPADAPEPWFRTFRESGDILITHVDLTPDARREARAFSWLDAGERARWRRYRHDRPRREFALCRAALRSLLCGRLGCANARLAFGASELGKPFGLVDGLAAPVSFSVSHGGGHGLVALAPRGRLGVDVEDRAARVDIDGVGETVFGPGERAEFAAARGEEKRRMFFTLWTLKEALIKALGTGFSLNPARFEIPPAMRRGAREGAFRFPHVPNVRWRLENLGNADFAAALAHERGR